MCVCVYVHVYVPIIMPACWKDKLSLAGSAVAATEAAITSTHSVCPPFFLPAFCRVDLLKFGQIGREKEKVTFIFGWAFLLVGVEG